MRVTWLTFADDQEYGGLKYARWFHFNLIPQICGPLGVNTGFYLCLDNFLEDNPKIGAVGFFNKGSWDSRPSTASNSMCKRHVGTFCPGN